MNRHIITIVLITIFYFIVDVLIQFYLENYSIIDVTPLSFYTYDHLIGIKHRFGRNLVYFGLIYFAFFYFVLRRKKNEITSLLGIITISFFHITLECFVWGFSGAHMITHLVSTLIFWLLIVLFIRLKDLLNGPHYK